MSETERNIRERIHQDEVTVMNSYLEVDFAEWLSNEEVPYAYEPFIIPSVVGPTKEEWDNVVDAIKAVGNSNFEQYEDLVDGTELEGMRFGELLSMWTEIYDKHKLAEEKITIPVQDSLSNFSKSMVLPDFVIYKDFHLGLPIDDFDWSSWDYIVEVSGLWGVGLPKESEESDWWDWYRVSGVAFKELAYRLLGLWDGVYWIVPDSEDIPKELRDDEHYVVAKTTQSDLGIEDFADKIGITTEGLEAKLSPPITPSEYKRPSYGLDNTMTKVEYSYDSINPDAIRGSKKYEKDMEDAVIISDDVILYHGYIGGVYVTDKGAFVRESQWDSFNMIMLREYVLDVVSKLSDAGVVEGLGVVK
jgi:hypothetical protein